MKTAQQGLKNRAALPAAAAAISDKEAVEEREERSILAAKQLATAAIRQTIALERQA
jgi:hypothetical protein